MNAIRFSKRIDSDTLHIPELKGMIGRIVEIIILDEAVSPAAAGGGGDWDTILAATQHLDGYDYQAQADQDACDLHDAEARLK